MLPLSELFHNAIDYHVLFLIWVIAFFFTSPEKRNLVLAPFFLFLTVFFIYERVLIPSTYAYTIATIGLLLFNAALIVFEFIPVTSYRALLLNITTKPIQMICIIIAEFCILWFMPEDVWRIRTIVTGISFGMFLQIMKNYILQRQK